MYRYSDSESRDSDEGIRFKTDSTRNKHCEKSSRRKSRSRSASPKSKLRRYDRVKRHKKKTRSSSSDESPTRKMVDTNNRKRETETAAIGTALPSRLLKKASPKEELPKSETAVIGPALPPHLLKKVETSEVECFGPQLPPHLLKKKPDIEKSSCIGPQLPAHLRQKLQEESSSTANINEDSDDGESYGPLPVGDMNYSKAQIALEERALQLKMDQLEPNQKRAPVREEWMLELPEVKATNLGLGPRQFRSKAGPDLTDRSSWTDTPDKKEKNKEVDLKKETEMREIRRRDEEQARIAKKHKKKNKESLLEMHQNEMKKKKKDEGEPSERRPFSREIDLKVNRFDEAQKKAVLKKAQLLDDRFSSGQSKFL